MCFDNVLERIIAILPPNICRILLWVIQTRIVVSDVTVAVNVGFSLIKSKKV